MPAEKVDLLDELKGEAHYSSAILGTYTFGGEFFEEQILPTIQALNVANIVVLTDTREYEAANELRQAGQRYYFDHVQCPGIHHPKYCLLLGHERGLGIIGSANLTEDGWRKNAELVTLFRYEEGESTEQEEAAFSELSQFLKQLVDDDFVSSRKTKDAIETALGDAPWITDIDVSSDDGDLQLLHNLNEAILPRVLDIETGNTIEKANIISPFFSGEDTSVLETLIDAGAEKLVLNIQPDSVEGFESESLNRGALSETDIQVNAMSMADEESRYIHAKILVLPSSSRVTAVFGSTNATRPALLDTAENANIELSVMRSSSDSGYFQDVIGSDVLDTAEIRAADVDHRRRNPSSPEINYDFQLYEAYIEADGGLIIELEVIEGDECTLHLRRGAADGKLEYSVSDFADGQIQIQNDEVNKFCREATQLFLTVETPEGQLESSRRWVALPSLESAPRPSEKATIENSNGRYGLIELLNRLEGWEALYHFLDAIEFESGESGRGGIAIRSIDPDDEEGGSGMEDREVTELAEVFENKVQ